MKLFISTLFMLAFQLIFVKAGNPSGSSLAVTDSVKITAVEFNGIKIGDDIKVLSEKWGHPYAYWKNQTAIDRSTIYVCTYNRSASFILNENETITDIDYIISPDVSIKIGDTIIHIGDDIAKLQMLFPGSYAEYLDGNKRAFYLNGVNEDYSYSGFKFQFFIRKGLIVYFNSYIEE